MIILALALLGLYVAGAVCYDVHSTLAFIEGDAKLFDTRHGLLRVRRRLVEYAHEIRWTVLFNWRVARIIGIIDERLSNLPPSAEGGCLAVFSPA